MFDLTISSFLKEITSFAKRKIILNIYLKYAAIIQIFHLLKGVNIK